MLASSQVTTSLAAFPADVRIDAWGKMCRDAMLGDLVWPCGLAPDRFDATLRRRWIDDILFVDSSASSYGASFRNDTDADGYIGFGLSMTNYGEHLTMRDSSVRELNTSVCLWANSRVRRYEQSTPGHSLMIYVPTGALHAHCGAVADRLDVVTDLDSPATRMMCAMLRALRRETEIVDADEALALRDSMVELLARIVARTEAPEPTAAVSGAMRQRVTWWIANHVHDGPVTPAQAASAHGISVRSLQRLFEESGSSFSGEVRSIRLAKARRDVVGTDDSLQVIAIRWGFADPSHFSREFRRTFDESPTQTRALARASASTLSGLGTLAGAPA